MSIYENQCKRKRKQLESMKNIEIQWMSENPMGCKGIQIIPTESNHWIPMESDATQGNSRESKEIKWNPMEFKGIRGNPMESIEIHWYPRESKGIQWKRKELKGIEGNPMGVPGDPLEKKRKTKTPQSS